MHWWITLIEGEVIKDCIPYSSKLEPLHMEKAGSSKSRENTEHKRWEQICFKIMFQTRTKWKAIYTVKGHDRLLGYVLGRHIFVCQLISSYWLPLEKHYDVCVVIIVPFLLDIFALEIENLFSKLFICQSSWRLFNTCLLSQLTLGPSFSKV